MRRISTGNRILLGLLCFVLAGYVLYPLAATMRESLKVGGEFSFGQYLHLFDPANKGNMEAVWNSVAVSFLSVLASGIVGVLFAFVFTQFSFPLKGILSRVAILPIALPPLVGVISFLFIFGESGIIPRLLQGLVGAASPPIYLEGVSAIVAIHTYSFYVYYYLFVAAALRQLDGSILEAAAILGSRPWRTFWKIILPELRPALIGASILTFMASMASFSAPLLFAGEHRFITLSIYTSKLNGELDLAAAQSIMLTLVSVAFFIVMNVTSGPRLAFRRSKGAGRIRPLEVPQLVRGLLIALAMVLLVIEVLPLATIILVSFAREGSWTWQLLPSAYTIDNYLRLLTDPGVFEPVGNSLIMSGLALLASLVIGVGGAVLIVKGGLGKSRFALDLILTIPYAVPGTVVAISMILAFGSPSLFSGGGVLVGTFWILPLAYIVRTYPLLVRSTAAALEQVDDSLMEAGETFGAGPWRRFRTIVLPLILPGITSGAVLAVIASLGEFVSSILLYTYASRPISVEILSQLRMFNFGSAAAYSVLLLIIILLVLLISRLVQRDRQ